MFDIIKEKGMRSIPQNRTHLDRCCKGGLAAQEKEGVGDEQEQRRGLQEKGGGKAQVTPPFGKEMQLLLPCPTQRGPPRKQPSAPDE